MATVTKPQKPQKPKSKGYWVVVALAALLVAAVYSVIGWSVTAFAPPKIAVAFGASVAAFGGLVALLSEANDDFSEEVARRIRVIGLIVAFVGGFILAALAWKDAGWVA